MTRGHACLLRIVACVPLLALRPDGATAQWTRFLAAGAGASFPTGDASRDMQAGWLAEIMGGVGLPGNVMSLRLAGSYGQNTTAPVPGGGTMMGGADGGTDRTIGGMVGVMVMPDIDRDVIPYALASAGIMNSRLGGSTTSFAWTAGLGTRLQTDIAEFYLEWRLTQATRGGEPRTMIPITVGIRIANW